MAHNVPFYQLFMLCVIIFFRCLLSLFSMTLYFMPLAWHVGIYYYALGQHVKLSVSKNNDLWIFSYLTLIKLLFKIVQDQCVNLAQGKGEGVVVSCNNTYVFSEMAYAYFFVVVHVIGLLNGGTNDAMRFVIISFSIELASQNPFIRMKGYTCYIIL